MSVSDPIADFLTAIRNAIRAKHRKVDAPATRIKTEIETIEKGDIPETEFKPPAGYHKGPLREVMFSEMNGGPGAPGGQE